MQPLAIWHVPRGIGPNPWRVIFICSELDLPSKAKRILFMINDCSVKQKEPRGFGPDKAECVKPARLTQDILNATSIRTSQSNSSDFMQQLEIPLRLESEPKVFTYV
ncbi:thioredoxin-like protein [Penicillium chermesinum]|uniref:Thioredoxin-like protein n=1 Tax=Penicillium chermesinum TaxID=63820 RepID=A0A9W9NBU5_9EURO|nr:thioredoxin-like protein [Penicillium chermesinum]KAJ5216958.1 thioredoxin-like protein [Penicillium chermesinum]KAJ6171428.1 thioredoxin-like protein [Penicillium chermesinum]